MGVISIIPGDTLIKYFAFHPQVPRTLVSATYEYHFSWENTFTGGLNNGSNTLELEFPTRTLWVPNDSESKNPRILLHWVRCLG